MQVRPGSVGKLTHCLVEVGSAGEDDDGEQQRGDRKHHVGAGALRLEGGDSSRPREAQQQHLQAHHPTQLPGVAAEGRMPCYFPPKIN